MSNFVDTMWEKTNSIERIAYQLDNLSHAMAKLGMGAADDLSQYSESLLALAKGIRDAASERVNSDFKQAQESSNNVLRAALAGLKLAKTTD